MPARRDEDRSPATTPRNSVETPPPRNWARELARPPATPRSSSAPAIPPVTPTGKVKKARQKLRNLVRKHLDRIRAKTARSPRNSRDSDSDEDLPKVRKYERLERAVRKQLAKGRAARRKLYELRHTIERRKNRKRARAAEKAAARASLLAGYASEGDRVSPPGTPPFKARQREFATASPLHRRSGSVSSVDVSSDDSSDDEVVDPLQQALQGVDRAAMASHLSLVTLGLVGYDLIQSEDYSFRRLATLAIAIACWLCHAG